MPPNINKSDLGTDGKTNLNSEMWIELRNIKSFGWANNLAYSVLCKAINYCSDKTSNLSKLGNYDNSLISPLSI
jgi:hypothetical protein